MYMAGTNELETWTTEKSADLSIPPEECNCGLKKDSQQMEQEIGVLQCQLDVIKKKLNKALKESESLTESRASTSSSLDRVCAVINNAFALLETDFREVLRQQLRQGYLSGYLAYSVLHTSIQQGRLDSEQARLMF
ncbi:uncharacterized protein [Periplaneta americana]|uniref:uncharacterized protein n=1 Tax=Periplaneta americana TaxID=6978 RepID=UPI0037E78E80